jgi:hypothetical protein
MNRPFYLKVKAVSAIPAGLKYENDIDAIANHKENTLFSILCLSRSVGRGPNFYATILLDN